MRSDGTKKSGRGRRQAVSPALEKSAGSAPRTLGRVAVRLACEKDVDAVAAILPLAHRWDSPLRAGWSDPEQLRLFLLSMGTKRARAARITMIVAEEEGRAVGASVYRHGVHRMSGNEGDGPPYSDVGLVDALAVRPDARRRGVGTAMVKWAEADLRRAGSRVMTLQCPESACSFYEALRYRVEEPETAALTFFPRQGQKAWTAHRPEEEPTARLAWKSLTGGRTRSAPYTHPLRGTYGVMVRGLIPGDDRRRPDWPTVSR